MVGVDANPEAFEHARAKYKHVVFERNMIELWQGDVDCVVFLQTIEHIQDPDAMLAHVRELIEPGGVAYVSTPNVLTLAPEGRGALRQPLARARVQAGRVPRAVRAPLRPGRPARALPRPQAARRTRSRSSTSAWDRVHKGLRFTKPFYDRFTPAISVRDFTFRRVGLDRSLDLLAVLRP